jgi:hypothetical protein
MPRLFKKQEQAMEALEPGQVLFKFGMYKFGACDQSFLIERMATTHTDLHEIIDGHSRLYVDAEHYFDVEPTAEKLQEWFRGLMAVLLQSITEHLPIVRGTEHKYQVTNDSRPSDGKYKASFHIVWSHIVFQTNTGAMKTFVLRYFDYKLKLLPNYRYVFQGKNDGLEIRSSVDPQVYTSKRSFRLTYAKKYGGQTWLKPWNDLEWCALELDQQGRQDFIEKMLVCYQDDEVVPIADPDEQEVARPRKRLRVARRDDEKEPEVKEAESLPLEDLEKARQLVAVLSRDRACGISRQADVAGRFEIWSHVIWCISNLFGASVAGEMVAQSFSSRAENYDKVMTASTYYRAKPGKWTMGSLVQWAMADNRAKAQVILRSFNSEPMAKAQAPCLDINDIKFLLAEEYAKLEELKEAEPKDKDAIKAKEAEICALSVPYLNQYLFMVTDCTPSIFGEEKLDHMGKKIVVWNKTLLDLMKGHGPLKAHIAAWAASPKMRKYNKTFVDMSTLEHSWDEVNQYRRYNLFTGFDYPPDYDKFPDNYEELCKPVLDHILNVWGMGHQASYDYNIRWMAFTIQKPWIKLRVALILKGFEGAGKGCILQMLAKIMGSKYFFQVSNIKQELLGQFKPEGFALTKLIFIDEATFGGDHVQAGMLKTLCSENTVNIEHKYLSRQTYESFCHFGIATNGDWAAHVGAKERRYHAMEVADSFAGMGQKEYFTRLHAVPISAFAKFLYSVDLTDWDPLVIPVTECLRDQKRQSMKPIESWAEWCLSRGYLYGDDVGVPQGFKWEEDLMQVTARQLYNSYTAYASTQRKQCRTLVETIFMKEFKKMFKLDNSRQVRDVDSGAITRYYDLPPLPECQKRFRFYENDPDWTFETL